MVAGCAGAVFCMHATSSPNTTSKPYGLSQSPTPLGCVHVLHPAALERCIRSHATCTPLTTCSPPPGALATCTVGCPRAAPFLKTHPVGHLTRAMEPPSSHPAQTGPAECACTSNSGAVQFNIVQLKQALPHVHAQQQQPMMFVEAVRWVQRLTRACQSAKCMADQAVRLDSWSRFLAIEYSQGRETGG